MGISSTQTPHSRAKKLVKISREASGNFCSFFGLFFNTNQFLLCLNRSATRIVLRLIIWVLCGYLQYTKTILWAPKDDTVVHKDDTVVPKIIFFGPFYFSAKKLLSFGSFI